MLRNYHYGPLKNQNHSFKLAQMAVSSPDLSIWSLPPKTVAYFAGELSRVMLEAAEQYVFEKTFQAASHTFQREAWRHEAENKTK